MLYAMNLAAAVAAVGMACAVLRPSAEGWSTRLGAVIHGGAGLALLYLALLAVFPQVSQ